MYVKLHSSMAGRLAGGSGVAVSGNATCLAIHDKGVGEGFE